MNCYQHIDIYHRVHALSGTPWNAKTFHHRLQYDSKMALGSDGLILQQLIEKNTPIIALTDENIIDINKHLKDYLQTTTHAIIDIGAILKGSNLQIAQKIKTMISSTTFKYILFYDEIDLLSALSQTNDTVIVIGKTDPKSIHDKINCPPAEYFTYYDQAHAIGADIIQDNHAHALCLIDKRTPIQAFLQGVMRMRKLLHQQSITILNSFFHRQFNTKRIVLNT